MTLATLPVTNLSFLNALTSFLLVALALTSPPRGSDLRILLIEDTKDVADAVAKTLQRAGYACDTAGSVAEANDYLSVQTYDLVILDIHLPDGDGRAILWQLRRAEVRTPVLMLTAEVEIETRVATLDAGADDYLVKPFDLRELEARVRVLTRRDAGAGTSKLRLGRLVFDTAGQNVHVGDVPLSLKRREMTLLLQLMTNSGRIVSKEKLFDSLYSFDDVEVSINAVELYIARLRKALDGSGVVIETHRGLGYRLSPEDGR